MKLIKKVLFVLLSAVGLTLLIIADGADRNIKYSINIPQNEIKEFHLYKTVEEVQEAYRRNFDNPKYTFPRGKVEAVKIYRNQFLISRFTSKTLSSELSKSIVNFLNEPENFDWSETTWSLDESEYILRLFDQEDNEIGKIWLCMEGCGMTESIPFAPSMKFGALSIEGREKLEVLTHLIYQN